MLTWHMYMYIRQIELINHIELKATISSDVYEGYSILKHFFYENAKEGPY
jgi:hypothetical protein